MPSITLDLPTDVETFTTWIQDHTAQVYLDFFPLSRGGCTLQPPKLNPETGSLTLDAFYWDGELPRSGSIHPHPAAVIIEINPHSDPGTCRVAIDCHYEPVATYCHDLAVAILMRWPSVQPQLNQLELFTPPDDDAAPSIWDWTSLDTE